MTDRTRRDFLRTASLAGFGLAAGRSIPTVLTARRTRPGRADGGTLVFRPYYPQRGLGPHLLDWAYASDHKWDAFHSDIAATTDGVTISDTEGEEAFGVNVRWNVEGFGYLFITADDAGEHYRLPGAGRTRTLNLNFELARSRVARNRARAGKFAADGWSLPTDVRGQLGLSEELLEDAAKAGDEERRGFLAQQSLMHALRGGEALEMARARDVIAGRAKREGFFIGCDARSFFHMDPDLFMERFTEAFDYATITHYIITGTTGMPDFEPVENDLRFDTREALLERLRREGMTVEGRPIFWPYLTVTPDWLRRKSFDEMKKYVERHTREVVGHYGDRMYAWEIVNEFHDWANESQLTPDQAVEITKLACDVAADTAPNVHRLINNCCPFAEYVQLRKWKDLDAIYPQRTPWEFMRDLVDAGVDFTITGQQMYFPYRDLQDTILLVERHEAFGRPIQLTEVGASSGPSRQSVLDGSLDFPEEPHIWHRPWDEELQADWLEGLYTLAYANPRIEAVNWYDLVDGEAFIRGGGLLRSKRGEKKAAFERLLRLKKEWGHG
jgi:GH35 family endo-1,4-beta-xylanase